jgi:hypothetical protein
MPTPAEIIDIAAAANNDVAQTVYTDAATLPYLNMALDDLQEIFELNNIPVTNEVSAVIPVTAGVLGIGDSGQPNLPPKLIEIRGLYERTTGTSNSFIPMSKREFLPHTTVQSTQLVYWAWVGDKIKFIGATSDIDVKMDFIRSIFLTPLAIGDVNIDLGIKGVKQFLGFRTGGLCAMFVGQNETRATALNELANEALERALGIPIKGKQSMPTRKRPFRASYKNRGYI